MTIRQDTRTLNPSAMVQLLVIDATSINGGIYYIHNGVDFNNNDVVWQGVTYSAFPYELTGIDISSSGTNNRPTLRVANITGGLFTLLNKQYNDLIGVKVTRKRTLARYLDAVNYPGATNPDANPNMEFSDDIYFIDRKASETRTFVEYELASSLDVDGVKLPRRQIIQNLCTWEYKDENCGYVPGDMFTTGDIPTIIPSQDQCGKKLSSCKLRFGVSAELPYGGFPGSGLFND